MSRLRGHFRSDSKRFYQRFISASSQQGQHSAFPDLPFTPVQAAQRSHDPEAHGLCEAHGRSGPGGEWVTWAEAFTRALYASTRADHQAPHGQRQRDAVTIFGSECFGNYLLLEYCVTTLLSGFCCHVLGRCQHGAYVSSGLWFLLLCVYVTPAASDNFTRGLKQNNKWALSPTYISSLGAHWFWPYLKHCSFRRKMEGWAWNQLKYTHTHTESDFSLSENVIVSKCWLFLYCLSAGLWKKLSKNI